MFELAQDRLCKAPVAESHWTGWIELDGPIKVLNCGLIAAEGGICGTSTVEDIRILWIDCEGLLVVLEGAVIFALVVVGVAPVLVGRGQVLFVSKSPRSDSGATDNHLVGNAVRVALLEKHVVVLRTRRRG